MTLRKALLSIAVATISMLGPLFVGSATPAQAASGYGNLNSCYTGITTLTYSQLEREPYCTWNYDGGYGIYFYDHYYFLYIWSGSGVYGNLNSCYAAIRDAVPYELKLYGPACSLRGTAYRIVVP